MKRIIAFLLVLLMVFGTTAALADIRPGEYVYLGHWEQNGNTGDGAERIRWLVIDVDGSYLFLMSDNALANLPFNKSSNGTTWGNSSLRQWLNNDFYRAAFDAREAAAILTTDVQDTAEHSYYDFNTANRFSGTTQDKVFLLSFLELCTYLTMQTAACTPTASVRNSNRNILMDGAYCSWWLRTSAYKNNAMMMSADGFSSAYEHHPGVCVRPVLWVDASVVTQ